jgi:transcriptional regulator with XRE-family HTH domain
MDKGLLIRELAEQLGVSEDTVINWEVRGVRPRGSLGEKIKIYRQALGLSRRALARELKIDPTTLARWERGKSRPLKVLLEKYRHLFISLNMVE